MERHFHHQLEDLKKSLLQMAALVETQIAHAVRALVERDVALCDEVIQGDQPINGMELDIDHQCIQLLALQQPIARDLRFIAAAMKINVDLERMGDIAVNIARRAKRLNDMPVLKPLIDIPRMATLAQSMVKESLDAFVRGDEHLAREVCVRDDEIDSLEDQIFRELLTYMMEQPRSVPQALQLIFISRHIERIADHATNIAESVVYFSQGKVIKHHADDTSSEGE
jgi:phosphate transport system protein